jgi:tetratricopeptide (TPR) repeat protein
MIARLLRLLYIVFLVLVLSAIVAQVVSTPDSVPALDPSPQNIALVIFACLLLLVSFFRHASSLLTQRRTQQAATLLKAERYAEAKAAYERLIERAPKQLALWAGLGQALVGLDQTTEALAAYDRALARWPDHTQLLRMQTLALVVAHRNTEALAACDRILARVPLQAHAWAYKAYVLERLQQPAGALAAGEQALRQDAPGRSEVLRTVASTRAYALNTLGRYDEALDATTQATASLQALPPLGPLVLRTRLAEVVALMGLQRHEDAVPLATHTLSQAEQALTVRPQNADLWEIKVSLLARLGQEAEAQAAEAQAAARQIDVRRR